MNNATIAGHLGADPEVRFTSSGKKVTTLRLAARARKSQNKDETIWWKVTIWGEEFDRMLSYVKKGSGLIIMGEMNKPEIFTDKEGRPQISMSMTAYHLAFSPFGKPDSAGRSSDGHDESTEHHESSFIKPSPAMAAASPGRADVSPFSEDEIPF